MALKICSGTEQKVVVDTDGIIMRGDWYYQYRPFLSYKGGEIQLATSTGRPIPYDIGEYKILIFLKS